MSKRVLVVGGVAGGASTAARVRRLLCLKRGLSFHFQIVPYLSI
jgi:hypothetical protein